eukprot:1156674-Pelagomonas_calceolata.AAC.6
MVIWLHMLRTRIPSLYTLPATVPQIPGYQEVEPPQGDEKLEMLTDIAQEYKLLSCLKASVPSCIRAACLSSC